MPALRPWTSQLRTAIAHHARRLGVPTAPPARRVPWGLIVLVSITTVATAGVSLWLVPVYWLVLALVMLAPELRTRRVARSRPHIRVPRAGPKPSAEPEPSSVEAAAPVAVELDEESHRRARSNTPKRGTGRSRRKTPASVEQPAPVAVTWVRVGPGQFVRIEAPAETAPLAPRETDAQPGPASIETVLYEHKSELSVESAVAIPEVPHDSQSEAVVDAVSQRDSESQAPIEPCQVGPFVSEDRLEVESEVTVAKELCEPPCAEEAHAPIDVLVDDLPQTGVRDEVPQEAIEPVSPATQEDSVADSPEFDVEAAVVPAIDAPGRVPAPLARAIRPQPGRFVRQSVRCRRGGRASGRGRVVFRPRRVRRHRRRVARSRMPREPPARVTARLASFQRGAFVVSCLFPT